MDDTEAFSEDYQSGPFCRHWGDPSDCENVCSRCSHACGRHDSADGSTVCNEPDCDCDAWVESE